MATRNVLAAAALAAGIILPGLSPVSAQTALRAGATVTDPQGGQVGTIVSIEGSNAVLRTDRHQIQLPLASFTATSDAVLVGVTREQLNADVDRMLAEAQQAIAVGATVRDRDGALVGPVQAVDEQSITVQLGEQLIRLPRSGVAPGANGLVIGATLAELQAAAAAPPPS